MAYCLFAGTFASFLKDKKARKKSQNSRNKGFSNYFCLMMEGSGSGRPKTTLHKISTFQGALNFLATKWPSLLLVPFKGPKKSGAPQNVSILCRDHLESLNWPHLVIWQGRFDNTTPHLQHRCIDSYTSLDPFLIEMSQVPWKGKNCVTNPVFLINNLAQQ